MSFYNSDEEEMVRQLLQTYQNAVQAIQTPVNRYQVVSAPSTNLSNSMIIRIDSVTGKTWALIVTGGEEFAHEWREINERPNDAETKNCEA